MVLIMTREKRKGAKPWGRVRQTVVVLAITLVAAHSVANSDVYDRVEHAFAVNDGVKIHYASLGEGPLVVMIHGFPDFWYTWRDQMDALSSDFKVVAVDLRLRGAPDEYQYSLHA